MKSMSNRNIFYIPLTRIGAICRYLYSAANTCNRCQQFICPHHRNGYPRICSACSACYCSLCSRNLSRFITECVCGKKICRSLENGSVYMCSAQCSICEKCFCRECAKSSISNEKNICTDCISRGNW